jgi:DNA-binding winged helix-turn-helix (wHTH) protein/tetratricopeptide (TPR) repeat protein
MLVLLPGIRGRALVATIEPYSDLRIAQPDLSLQTDLNRRLGDMGSLVASLGRRRGDVRSVKTPLGRRGRAISDCFAGFRLEADGTLWRGGDVVHLPPKELAALRVLVAQAGQVVSPLQLKKALWGDVHVTADSVPKCLSSLRARLAPESCIQTVYKRGYRLAAEVQRESIEPAASLSRLAIVPFFTYHFVPRHLGPSIAEETIALLSNARFPTLSVLARDSIFTLAGRGLTAQQIGEALNADLVLTGSLRALSSQFRLRAEMIRVDNGEQIWVEDMLVDKGRIAGLELELVRRLAWRLGAGVSGDKPVPNRNRNGKLTICAVADSSVERESSPQRREAYENFLRGRHEWQSLHRHRMQDGLQHLLKAIEVDPSLISAKVDLVNLCVTQSFYGFMSPGVAAGYVRRMAESIPDLPHQAEAILPALGWVNFHFDHDLPAALKAFAQSVNLSHGTWITRVRVMFALSRRRFAEAIEILRAAIQLDPYSPWLHDRLAWAFHLDGQAAESLRHIQIALSLFPDHEFTNFYGALILAFNGETERATELAENLVQRVPFFDLATAAHAYALACQGRKDEARSILERLQWLSRERFLLSSFTPAVHVALGNMDAAIEELQTACNARCPWFFQMLADPRLKPLHGIPEFKRMQSILTTMEIEAAEVELGG